MGDAMVTTEDIKIINDALKKGFDVRIQNTPEGYRIVADRVNVLKRVLYERNPTKSRGYSDEK